MPWGKYNPNSRESNERPMKIKPVFKMLCLWGVGYEGKYNAVMENQVEHDIETGV